MGIGVTHRSGSTAKAHSAALGALTPSFSGIFIVSRSNNEGMS